MKRISLISSIPFIIAAFATPVMAQERAASAPIGSPAAMPQDCGKSPTKPHDHGEMNKQRPGTSGASTAMPCAPVTAASNAAKATMPAHDHGKFHKGQ